MREEARASPFEVFSFGICVAQEFEEIQVIDKEKIVLAWIDNDNDLIDLSREARRLGLSCQRVDDEEFRYQVRFEEIEEVLSDSETEDLNQEIFGFRQALATDKTIDQEMFAEQRRAELRKLLDQIIEQSDYVNMMFQSEFGCSLLREFTSTQDFVSIPPEGFSYSAMCTRVLKLPQCLIKRIKREAVGKNGSIKKLKEFLENKGLTEPTCIQTLGKIRDLRDATAHPELSKYRKVIENFIQQYELEDKIDLKTEAGDFYPLYYEILKLNLAALTQIRDDLLTLIDILKRKQHD